MSSVDVLKAGMMLHSHHVRLRLRSASIISSIIAVFIVVIVSSMLVCEVVRALVFVGSAIVLEPADYLIDI